MSALFTLDVSERTKMLQEKQRERLAEAARWRESGAIVPPVPISDGPIYFAGNPDPSQFVDLTAYTRLPGISLEQVSPLESGCIAPQQSWIEPSVGYAQLGGHLQVPSTSAFGRALKPSDIRTPYEAGSLGYFNPPPGTSIASVTPTHAVLLWRWVCAIYSDVLAASSPQERKAGNCMLCGEFKTPCVAAHLLFGPHGAKWARAVEHDGYLSFTEWRRFVVVVLALKVVNHAKFSPIQENQTRWIMAQYDPLFDLAETVDEPLFPMPGPGRIVAGVEYLLPFVDWLKDWARLANSKIAGLEEARKAREASYN